MHLPRTVPNIQQRVCLSSSRLMAVMTPLKKKEGGGRTQILTCIMVHGPQGIITQRQGIPAKLTSLASLSAAGAWQACRRFRDHSMAAWDARCVIGGLSHTLQTTRCDSNELVLGSMPPTIGIHFSVTWSCGRRLELLDLKLISVIWKELPYFGRFILSGRVNLTGWIPAWFDFSGSATTLLEFCESESDGCERHD
jgi:hypothetical protein